MDYELGSVCLLNLCQVTSDLCKCLSLSIVKSFIYRYIVDTCTKPSIYLSLTTLSTLLYFINSGSLVALIVWHQRHRNTVISFNGENQNIRASILRSHSPILVRKILAFPIMYIIWGISRISQIDKNKNKKNKKNP